jgi:hypothetical protein
MCSLEANTTRPHRLREDGRQLLPWDYFRIARDSGGIHATPEMDTLQESQAGFGIC